MYDNSQSDFLLVIEEQKNLDDFERLRRCDNWNF